MSSNEAAVAWQIDLSGGRRIWVPPKGRPYWAHTHPRAVDLSDDEIREHLPQIADRLLAD